MGESWKIQGEYFESCNCAVLCPCLLVRPQVAPTEGHCDVVVAFHVNSGNYGSLDLAGFNAVIAIYTPGIMSHGNWTVATYVDERAKATEQEALAKIVSAQAGGPLSRFAPLIAKRLPARAVAIDFQSEGAVRKLSIPGITEVVIEGITGARDQVVWLENVAHFADKRIAAARGSSSHYQDHGLRFDNSGRNGHYASINWSNA